MARNSPANLSLQLPATECEQASPNEFFTWVQNGRSICIFQVYGSRCQRRSNIAPRAGVIYSTWASFGIQRFSTWKTDFARSRPTVVMFNMWAPPLAGPFNATSLAHCEAGRGRSSHYRTASARPCEHNPGGAPLCVQKGVMPQEINVTFLVHCLGNSLSAENFPWTCAVSLS